MRISAGNAVDDHGPQAVCEQKQGETSMQMRKACTIINFSLVALLVLSMGCTQPLTKREQAGLVGGGLGAASGAIIGSSVGHATAGALIGGAFGLFCRGPSCEQR